MDASILTRPLLSTLRTAPRRQLFRHGQWLHSSARALATSIPHPATPGPPPEPPVQPTSEAEDRFARKQKQAELLKKSQYLRNDSGKGGSPLQKRFWKDVSIKETSDGLQVMLDARPVRTALKDILHIPSHKQQLAAAIALEWDHLVSAQQALKQHYIPLTSLTSRAVDIAYADREGNSKIRDDLVKMLLKYLNTDTLLCWAPENEPMAGAIVDQRDSSVESLRSIQKRIAEPIIAHLSTRVWPGAEILPILDPNSILPKPQPQMTLSIVQGWLTGLPAFELAGLERAVLATKSLLIGSRLLAEWSSHFHHTRDDTATSRFGIETAAEAATLEVRWQTDMWGEVEDTHDVDREDIRRQLGSVILLVQ